MLMTIKEMYQDAIQAGCDGLVLLIEFLVFEKQTVCFSDPEDVLKLYFKPNNKARMNKLLLEYRGKVNQNG
jgi:hypothetical protein